VLFRSVAVVVACPAAFAADEKPKKDDQSKKDLKALEGTWKLVSQTKDGTQADKDKLEGMSVTIKGDKWEVKKDDTVLLSGTVTLDASKKPKAADWKVTSDGALKDKTALAIYKVEKDKFHHCYGETRPEKFESGEGSKVTYDVFERVKKKE